VRSRSIPVDLDDGFSEGLWRFLREIVPDPTGDEPVRISALSSSSYFASPCARLGGCNGHRRSVEKTAALMVDFL
jgi:hypothetical protein